MSGPRFQPVAPRLEAKSTLVPFCGCRLWFGPSVPRGYGVLSIDGKNTYTHRAAWVDANGAIPAGMHVLHACDVPACINVDHLFLGTQLDNVRDMRAKGRDDYKTNKPRGDKHRNFGKAWSAGELSHRAKLSKADVVAIRAAYVPGVVRQVDLAKQFGIKQAQISAILRGTSWLE